jgi:hypothetical protein
MHEEVCIRKEMSMDKKDFWSSLIMNFVVTFFAAFLAILLVFAMNKPCGVEGGPGQLPPPPPMMQGHAGQPGEPGFAPQEGMGPQHVGKFHKVKAGAIDKKAPRQKLGKKDMPPMGPQGPEAQGPKGPMGPQGPQPAKP